METLHKSSYSIEEAMCSLIPSSGPVLCRDEIEDWSASEANLFEEALDKYGKDFNDIRQDFVRLIYIYFIFILLDNYIVCLFSDCWYFIVALENIKTNY